MGVRLHLPGRLQPNTERRSGDRGRTRTLTIEHVGVRPDLVIHSYPKTGRTWLRFLIANYLSLTAGNPQPITLQNVYDIVPNWDTEVHGRGMSGYSRKSTAAVIAMSHTPPSPSENFPIALLIRDPRDTLVSHWHHANHHYDNDLLTIEQFILSAGPEKIYSHALAVLSDATNSVHVLSYEEMHRSASSVLENLLTRAGLTVDAQALETSVEMSSFNRMQKIEAQYGMKNIAYDISNPLARRVRRGIIGSHRDELPMWVMGRVREVHAAQPAWLREVYEHLTGIGYSDV